MTYEASRIVYRSRDELAVRMDGMFALRRSSHELRDDVREAIAEEFDRLADRLEKEVAEMLEWNSNPANPGSGFELEAGEEA